MNNSKELLELRAAFAARELSYPFRRWYERATLDEVNQWHGELNDGWALIRRCQRVIVVPFGYSRIGRWLNALVTRAVEVRQKRRDAARVATAQKTP